MSAQTPYANTVRTFGARVKLRGWDQSAPGYPPGKGGSTQGVHPADPASRPARPCAKAHPDVAFGCTDPREGTISDVARNIELVERLERAYNERDYDTVRACVAADLVAHTPGSEMMPAGVEGAIAANEGGFSSFSNKRTEILEIFGDGDRVVSHVRMTGTNDGGIAWGGIPANGKPIDVDWIQISRHGDDGTIQETWAQMDLPTMMIQVGAMPAPEGM